LNTPLKTKVKYWFDFLRLAHQSKDPEVIANLKKDTYKSWGNYSNTSFDEWWKKYSNLFKEPSSIKRLTLEDKIQDDVFTIQFPFTYPSTTAAKIFKEMYEREFEERRTVKRKLKKIYGGSFTLTVDDLKVDKVRYYLLYARKVYLPLKFGSEKVSTKDYIKKAEEVFKGIKKLKGSSKESAIPFQPKGLENDYENEHRSARRYNIYIDNIIFNVSNGIFPGEYEKPRNPVKIEKKKPVYKVRKQHRGVPRSKYEDYKHRESDFDMYAKRRKRVKKSS
jgi:hypothetical protein